MLSLPIYRFIATISFGYKSISCGGYTLYFNVNSEYTNKKNGINQIHLVCDKPINTIQQNDWNELETDNFYISHNNM